MMDLELLQGLYDDLDETTRSRIGKVNDDSI